MSKPTDRITITIEAPGLHDALQAIAEGLAGLIAARLNDLYWVEEALKNEGKA